MQWSTRDRPGRSLALASCELFLFAFLLFQRLVILPRQMEVWRDFGVALSWPLRVFVWLGPDSGSSSVVAVSVMGVVAAVVGVLTWKLQWQGRTCVLLFILNAAIYALMMTTLSRLIGSMQPQ